MFTSWQIWMHLRLVCHSPTQSVTQSLSHSLTRSLAHSLARSLTQYGLQHIERDVERGQPIAIKHRLSPSGVEAAEEDIYHSHSHPLRSQHHHHAELFRLDTQQR